jgi:DNA-binding beta-propeller fold protein YncE
LKINPDTVFVGGWNEWIAYKQPWGDEYMLCDAASKEFSRDIEPMRSGYQDAFYIQLIKNIRNYKGLNDNVINNCKKSIDIDRGIKQWDDVKYAYINTDEKMISRNSYGGSKTIKYTQPAPDNRIIKIKVCHDDEYIYFLILSDNRISLKNNATNSMNIFIGTGEPTLKGWEGYEYVIGRYGDKHTRYIEKLSPDYTGSKTGAAKYSVNEKYMQVRIPRKSIGLNNGENEFYFKVADNISKPSDIMDYYISGISLPLGRLSFSYKIK